MPGDPARRIEALVRGGAEAEADHPLFLRLFYLLALEGSSDQTASTLVARVRRQARDYFAEAITALLSREHPPEVARVAASELARFAVAYSDGCFFAAQLEPTEADLRQMYADLVVALGALAPAAIARANQVCDIALERR